MDGRASIDSVSRGRYLSTGVGVQKPEYDRSSVTRTEPAGDRIEHSAKVPVDLDGARLDQAAAALFNAYSRGRHQDWIRSGALLLDGKCVKPRDRVRSGSILSLSAVLEPEVAWTGEQLPLTIIFEDDDLIVIDKPPGLVVHPGAGNPRGTLVNALLDHRSELCRLPRGGIVHRLDKDTSGLLVVAASLRAHSALVDQLQRKDVAREYYAIVRGSPSGGGRINAPIGRHPKHRTRMAVVPSGGKEATTHFRINERLGAFTAVDVQLETGRTHQIRVHMAHRGYPLLGDPVYGGRQQVPGGMRTAARDTLRAFPRQALHAQRLTFMHPTRGENCDFESPVPPDLQQLLSVLRSESAG